MLTTQDHELVALVRRAADGDTAALECLVDRFDGQLRAVLRFYRLSAWDEDDVIQSTWLRFMEHGHSLREPAAIKGWLATTARRQSFTLMQRRVRELPTDEPTCGEDSGPAGPCEELIAGERRAVVRDAVAELPVHNRRLMTLMIARPGISYEEVGEVLGIPVGSIGPTRRRSMSRLGRMRQIRALRD